METYATMRGRGWATREALDDAGERSNLVREGEMTGRMRWVRSYFVREDDDSLGPSGVSARKHGRARAPARGARRRLAWRGRTRPARGEAGVGKTRLATDALGGEGPGLFLAVGASPSGTPPYGPVLAAARLSAPSRTASRAAARRFATSRSCFPSSAGRHAAPTRRSRSYGCAA